jgi:hypothetical protein
VIVVFLFVSISIPLHAEKSSCVTCHTSAKSFKEITDTSKRLKLSLSSPSPCEKCHRDIAQLDGSNFHISPALLARHEWLPLREKHFGSLDCMTCHNPSLKSPTKDCCTCH